LTDEQIIQEVRKGNDSAYKELVLRYESLVASTVIGMIGRRPEAEDIGQEVFIRFYNAINNFRGDASVGTYLTRIGINLSLNEIKRRKRKQNIFIDKDYSELEDLKGESMQYTEGDREVIDKAIQSLDPKFRSVVVLRLIDGYSTKEVSRILKIPIGTVLSRLARAQEKLKQILAPIMELNHGL
jgi:RNA polymerase sigma-70 factor (ECF subfamily)